MTNRQKEVLDFILKFNREHGHFPRQADISRGLYITRSAVNHHVKSLSKKHLKVIGGLVVEILWRK